MALPLTTVILKQYALPLFRLKLTVVSETTYAFWLVTPWAADTTPAAPYALPTLADVLPLPLLPVLGFSALTRLFAAASRLVYAFATACSSAFASAATVFATLNAALKAATLRSV